MRAQHLARLAVISTLIALGLTGTAWAATTSLPTAAFAKTSDWGTGFAASYTITNAMPVTLNSWVVSFTLPATEKVTSLWDGVLTTNGNTYTATNASYNAPLAPGATATFGFNVSVSGTEAVPGACTLNGNPCDGSADHIPPSTPTGLAVLSTTSNSVSMNWNAATDNLEVASYNVFQGNTKVASTPGTVITVSGLAASSSFTFSVQAVDEVGNVSGLSNTVTATTKAGGGSNHLPGIAAPFVDIGAFPTPNLTQIAETTGLRDFSLASSSMAHRPARQRGSTLLR